MSDAEKAGAISPLVASGIRTAVKILPVEQCDFRLQPEERSATRQSQHQSTVARAEFDQPQSS